MYSNVQQHDSSVCATAVPSMMSSEIDASKERVFDGFEVTRVLSESDRLKSMTLLGGWPDKPGQAVITLTKRPFEASRAQGLLSEGMATLLHFQNDVYAKYDALATLQHNTITVDTIYPATEKHISKHTPQKYIMVKETSQHYTDRVASYIKALPEGRLKWVYNILDKKAEEERLLFEDADPETGFMLHPDLKWDQIQTDSMYCIALCHRRGIASLRSLTQAHLPLLNNIKAKAFKAITEKFGIPADQIRAYVHYHPSYYHFHVHLMHVKVDTGPGMAAGKAHLLDDVIGCNAIWCCNEPVRPLHWQGCIRHPSLLLIMFDMFGRIAPESLRRSGCKGVKHAFSGIIKNVTIPGYYAKRTMHFTLGENDPLYKSCFLPTELPQHMHRASAQAEDEEKVVKKSRNF